MLAAAAERVVRERAGRGPFFLTVAPVAPHLERSDARGKGTAPRPAPRHAGRFADEPLPAKASLRRGRRQRQAALDAAAASGSRPRRAPTCCVPIARSSLRCSPSTSWWRAWSDALQETGELERTLIVFTSDNGFFHGEHRIRDGKFLPYEEAIRVPLLIRGPGFSGRRGGGRSWSPTSTSRRPCSPPPAPRAGRRLDGVPLQALAADPREGRDRPLLLEALEGNRATYTAVRTERWLWVEYDDGGRELYDLEQRPAAAAQPPCRQGVQGRARGAGGATGAAAALCRRELPLS